MKALLKQVLIFVFIIYFVVSNFYVI